MFTGTLYPKQIPAAEKLCNRRRMLLAWEQGTGKTVISIAAATKLFELEKATTALVLAPGSFAWQWEDKIKEFSTCEVKYAEAKKKDTRTYHVDTPRSFYVVPWSLFRRDYDRIVDQPWDIVIADEAQEFSNVKSKTGHLIKRLNVAQSPTYRWALTGTAISNKLEELYSIMYWIDKSFLPPWPFFDENHIVRGEFGEIKSYRNLKSLSTHLEKRMDRKTHADMDGDMPEIVYDTITIPQSKEYKSAEANLLTCLDRLVGNIRFDEDGSPSLPKNSPVRKAFHAVQETLWTEPRKESVLSYVYRLLGENDTNRVVLFSRRKGPLAELEAELNGPFVQHATRFTGDESSKQKRESIRLFKEGERRVLLCSDAGNAGLDLPFARYLANIDVPMSWGKRDQRNKRIARLSSDFSTVVVTDFLMEESIEMYYYQATKNKGRLADATYTGAEDEVVMRAESLRNFLTDD